MRANKAALVVPGDVVANSTNKQFGVPTMRDLMREIDQLKRNQAALQSTLAALTIPSAQDMIDELGLSTDPLSNIDFKFAGPIADKAVKGSVTATVITSTTGTTVVNFNLGPLVEGVPYLVIAEATLASNADPAGFIFSMVRIVNSGSGTDGMQTGTASGERSLSAPLTAIVWGTGGSINIAGRARVSSGTGSVNDAAVWAVAIPLNMMAFREAL